MFEKKMPHNSSQGWVPTSRAREEVLVPSSSPPLLSSSPPIPTSSAPPYTDGRQESNRRGSTGSDSSLFSDFSLTPASEAGLRAWEQVVLANPGSTLVPSNNPTSQATRRWVVFRGRVPGIYKTAESARGQTDGIPNAFTLSYTNSALAERDYHRFQVDNTLPPFGSGPWVVYAGRSTGVFTELGDVKAAIDGYPNSHYVSCASVREAAEMWTLFQSLLPGGAQASMRGPSQEPHPASSQPLAPTSLSHGATPNGPSNRDPGPIPGSSSTRDPGPIPGSSSNRDASPTLTNSSDIDLAPSAMDNGEPERPFQPFIFDNSVRDLRNHESWWVTWAAVAPGVYYGLDALLAAGPMRGGYRSVENQTEGFDLFHILVQSRLIRKLRAPPS